jgi:hypothetical protein
MPPSEQTPDQAPQGLGISATEFIAYCDTERERRRNSGEPFDEERFAQALELVLAKLRVLADEGWT